MTEHSETSILWTSECQSLKDVTQPYWRLDLSSLFHLTENLKCNPYAFFYNYAIIPFHRAL